MSSDDVIQLLREVVALRPAAAPTAPGYLAKVQARESGKDTTQQHPLVLKLFSSPHWYGLRPEVISVRDMCDREVLSLVGVIGNLQVSDVKDALQLAYERRFNGNQMPAHSPESNGMSEAFVKRTTRTRFTPVT